ncbi:MAG: class I SAM-dependent methyltransferase [Gemmatimonadota bacterium]
MGTADVQGPLWGSRAREWATIQEQALRAGYEAVMEDVKIGHGIRLLDIGCGAGMFCRMAAGKGAQISGIDASAELLAIARERVAAGDFHQGDMESLPWADASFDVITGFNSLQYAGSPLRALQEARRVGAPGGTVVVMVWGKPEQCDATGHLRALEALLPPVTAEGPGRFAFSSGGALESLVKDAGLSLMHARDVETEWRYPDEATAIRGLSSAGPAVRASRHSGPDTVARALAESIAPYRQPPGHYLLRNTFRYVIAGV